MLGSNWSKGLRRLIRRYAKQGLSLFWGVIILGVVVNVGSSWLTTKDFDLRGTPVALLVSFPWLTGLVLVVLLVLTILLAREAGEIASNTPAVQNIATRREVLLRVLTSEYRRQHAKIMQHVEEISLTLEEQIAVVAAPATHQLPATLAAVAPMVHTSIVEAYDEAGSGLLVLGAPGMGKSTSLRTLALELLQRAEHESAQPLPLIFNLTSWSEKQSSLAEWLVEQISTLHLLTRQESRIWIEQHQFLFLLDGLDEVAEHARFSCVEAINTFRKTCGSPLVICSRTREYKALQQQRATLMLPYAVEVQPLTQQQVKEHLKRLGRAYAGVRAALQGNAVLRDLVTTPLLLSIVVLTYRGKQVKDLPSLGTPQEQQKQIFERYVAQRLGLSRSSWRFPPDEMRYWLKQLAQQMQQQQQTELYLERLQPSWLPGQQWQRLFRWTSMIPLGVIVGGMYVFLSTPVVGILVGGVVIQGFGRVGRDIEPVEHLQWSWRKVAHSRESLLGLLGGVVTGFLGGVSFGAAGGMIAGVFFCLMFALVFGLETGPLNEHKRLFPNQGIHASGRNALRTGLGVIVILDIVIGLVYGANEGLTAGWFNGIIAGVIYGVGYSLIYTLLFGVFAALYYGGTAYTKHYVLRCYLWGLRVLPLRTVHFLNEACERALLKRDGGRYSFIHPLFQEFFAS